MEFLTNVYNYLVVTTTDPAREMIRYMLLTFVSALICLNIKPKNVGLVAAGVCGVLIGGIIGAATLAFATHIFQKEIARSKEKTK
jgi:hypothetical protein